MEACPRCGSHRVGRGPDSFDLEVFCRDCHWSSDDKQEAALAKPQPDPCLVCGASLIRVKLFSREWWECPNSVLEFFDGMRRGEGPKFYDGPSHAEKEKSD